jgi:hypothetical protein
MVSGAFMGWVLSDGVRGVGSREFTAGVGGSSGPSTEVKWKKPTTRS